MAVESPASPLDFQEKLFFVTPDFWQIFSFSFVGNGLSWCSVFTIILFLLKLGPSSIIFLPLVLESSVHIDTETPALRSDSHPGLSPTFPQSCLGQTPACGGSQSCLQGQSSQEDVGPSLAPALRWPRKLSPPQATPTSAAGRAAG